VLPQRPAKSLSEKASGHKLKGECRLGGFGLRRNQKHSWQVNK
jgi:hypothetical protein